MSANSKVTAFMYLIVLVGFIVAMYLLLTASPVHFSSLTQNEIKERAEIQIKWDGMIDAIRDGDEERIEELSRWLDEHAGTSFEKLDNVKSSLICAWCGADMGEANTSEDTHGICKSCKSMYFPSEE